MAVGRGRSSPLAGGKLQSLETAAFPKPYLSVLNAFLKALIQERARQERGVFYSLSSGDTLCPLCTTLAHGQPAQPGGTARSGVPGGGGAHGLWRRVPQNWSLDEYHPVPWFLFSVELIPT